MDTMENVRQILAGLEGTCPQCGKVFNMLESAEKRRQADIGDNIVICPACSHAYLYAVEADGKHMKIGKDVTPIYAKNLQASPATSGPAAPAPAKEPDEPGTAPDASEKESAPKCDPELCINCRVRKAKNRQTYGVMERYHYDDRYSTADRDSGPTNYKALGIVRFGICETCQSIGTKSNIKSALFSLLGGALMFFIGIRAESNVNSAIGVVGMALFIFGLVKLIKQVSRKRGLDAVLEGLKSIDPGYILYAPGEGPMDVRRVEGSLQNRKDYRYEYIPEKKLQGDPGKPGKAATKKAAMHELRRWYKEKVQK